jgi:hypothetical protein
MTLVVGFNFGPYALLAADTRVSSYPPSGPRFEDDRRKIVRTSRGGLATGAGMIALLAPVKVRLTGDLAFVDDVLRAIAETREAVEARYPNAGGGSQQYTTTYEYDTSYFGDYHHPETVTEVGDAGTRTTSRTY